jgi:hypothetical protein
VDPNPTVAYGLANGLNPSPLSLPHALSGVDARARFIESIDGLILVDAAGTPDWERMGQHLRMVVSRSEAVLPRTGALDRIAVALRLWTGCIEAAKTIALGTRSGPNSAEIRAAWFSQIDARAATDAVYRAGVEAAPAFQRERQNEISFDGVPEESAVRRYA